MISTGWQPTCPTPRDIVFLLSLYGFVSFDTSNRAFEFLSYVLFMSSCLTRLVDYYYYTRWLFATSCRLVWLGRDYLGRMINTEQTSSAMLWHAVCTGSLLTSRFYRGFFKKYKSDLNGTSRDWRQMVLAAGTQWNSKMLPVIFRFKANANSKTGQKKNVKKRITI